MIVFPWHTRRLGLIVLGGRKTRQLSSQDIPFAISTAKVVGGEVEAWRIKGFSRRAWQIV